MTVITDRRSCKQSPFRPHGSNSRNRITLGNFKNNSNVLQYSRLLGGVRNYGSLVNRLRNDIVFNILNISSGPNLQIPTTSLSFIDSPGRDNQHFRCYLGVTVSYLESESVKTVGTFEFGSSTHDQSVALSLIMVDSPTIIALIKPRDLLSGGSSPSKRYLKYNCQFPNFRVI